MHAAFHFVLVGTTGYPDLVALESNLFLNNIIGPSCAITVQPNAILNCTTDSSYILTHFRGPCTLYGKLTWAEISRTWAVSVNPLSAKFCWFFFLFFCHSPLLFKKYLFHLEWSHRPFASAPLLTMLTAEGLFKHFCLWSCGLGILLPRSHKL